MKILFLHGWQSVPSIVRETHTPRHQQAAHPGPADRHAWWISQRTRAAERSGAAAVSLVE